MTTSPPPHAAATDTPPAKDKARWGKWTPEEEAYTSRLIADFTAGVLTDIENGTTMRSWLSAQLRCCPMRISKKFVGEQSIGKRMFERNEGRLLDMSDAQVAKRQSELKELRDAFNESWVREEREREEHKANGTRKRKRNRSKTAAKATSSINTSLLRHASTIAAKKLPSPPRPPQPSTLSHLQAKAAPTSSPAAEAAASFSTVSGSHNVTTSVQSVTASLTFLQKFAGGQGVQPSSQPATPSDKVALRYKNTPTTQPPPPPSYTCSPIKRRKAVHSSSHVHPPIQTVAAAPLATPKLTFLEQLSTPNQDDGGPQEDLGHGEFDCSFDFLDADDSIDALWLLGDDEYALCCDGGKDCDTVLSPTAVADQATWPMLGGVLSCDVATTTSFYDSLFEMSCY
ncbi:hypothetical protein DYB34_012437 [Aphanomyces astaci]|uniref:Uncharacterized protein n=1 Tax=Aphanomyces astaci TaxID=112090 RepID=A0A3R6Z023_APHAT|nr:hypothetical protein DYB34_012437 [Aphanomyces astaci]